MNVVLSAESLNMAPLVVFSQVHSQMNVVLSAESLLMAHPLLTLGEHAVPLYFDPVYVKGQGENIRGTTKQETSLYKTVEGSDEPLPLPLLNGL
jgi:hypothetical protein